MTRRRDLVRSGLSRRAALKAAAAGLDLGGGKAVIIGDPRRDKSERLWRAYGRMVDSLNGRYITAEDVGTTALDLAMVANGVCGIAPRRKMVHALGLHAKPVLPARGLARHRGNERGRLRK